MRHAWAVLFLCSRQAAAAYGRAHANAISEWVDVFQDEVVSTACEHLVFNMLNPARSGVHLRCAGNARAFAQCKRRRDGGAMNAVAASQSVW